MQLKENGSLEPDSRCPYPIFSRGKDRRYLKKAMAFEFSEIEKKFEKPENDWLEYSTIIIPRFQMNCFGINHDFNHNKEVFKGLQGIPSCHISSGYFNLHPEYFISLANYRGYNAVKILFPSLDTNGFDGAQGIKGYVPSAYQNLACNFLRECHYFRTNVVLYTYDRPDWTFHAKGMWLDIDEGTYYYEFGSSNYGRRSVERDLELQFSLISIKKQIRSKFQNEKTELWRYAKPFDDIYKAKRSVPILSRLLSAMGKSYL